MLLFGTGLLGIGFLVRKAALTSRTLLSTLLRRPQCIARRAGEISLAASPVHCAGLGILRVLPSARSSLSAALNYS
jgi:hypothetical protein